MSPETKTAKPNNRNDWRKWCRLCAKNDPDGNISVFQTNSSNIFDATLAAAIGKYFWVNIKIDDHLSRDLCIQCHTLMTELIGFADRVNKVQAMYCVLENVSQTASINPMEVRKQYGLFEDDWEHIIKLDSSREPVIYEETILSTPDGVEQIPEEQIVEYEVCNEFQKKTRKIIKKENEIPMDEIIIDEYVEVDEKSIIRSKETPIIVVEKSVQAQSQSQGDYEDYDINDSELNDTDLEVEFMNDMETNDAADLEFQSDNVHTLYKCNICMKRYKNPGCFRKHVLQAHNVKTETTNLATQVGLVQDGLINDKSQKPSESTKSTDDEKIVDVVDDLDCDKFEINKEENSNAKNGLKKRPLSVSNDENPTRLLLKKVKTDACGENSNTIRYRCDLCSRPYKSPGCYRRHMYDAHQIEASIEELPCDMCEETFFTEKQLAAHKRRHLHPSEKLDFECTYCEKRFTTSGALRQHINGIHFNEKPFVCDECGKSMKTLAALNEHKLVHTDDKPIECEICGKCFKNKARMKVHMDTHAETGYVCNICGQALNTRRTLRMHMLVHTDEKQYKCTFCPTEFKRSKALKNHLILHTGLRPYKCPYCDKTFSNGSNCRSHKKKVHPIELAKDEANGIKHNDQEYVPDLNDLRTGNHIQSVKKINRNRTGGLTPRMRALLIAAERQVEQNSEIASGREDSDNLDSMDSYAVDEDFEAYDVNEQEVQTEMQDGVVSGTVAVQAAHEVEDDGAETIIYEVFDDIQ